MHPLILPLLLTLLALSPSLSLSDPDPLASADRSALLRFKNSTRSDPFGLLSQWAPRTDHCSWPGVACDPSSRVVALNISAAEPNSAGPSCSRSGPFRPACPDPALRLSGQLTPSLGDLTALEILSLPFHRFSGEIPGDIWGLQNLQVVNLEGNLLTGTLAYVSRFPKTLQVLNLASNFITGEIPVTLSSSVNLQILDLSVNAINGSIPEFIGGFSKLKDLHLSFNRIGSSIPEKIGNCRSLEVLDLSGNLLVEGIPRSLGNCSELRYLLLSSNLLDDIIPSDLGRLRKLRVLDVSRNSLSGQVPAELGNCVDLLVLVLSNQYDPMPNEDPWNYVDNEFNYFQGGLSEKITALPKLRILWAPRTTLEGEFPKDWGACKSLEMVNLGENLFTGEIPAGFGGCKNLKLLNLSSNNLTGWLREELPVPCMAIFDVSGNKLSGTIPKFIYEGCPSSPLPPDVLPVKYSSFFGYRTLKGINLPYFESAGNLAVYHNFGRNNFSGSVPSFPTDGFGNLSIYAFLADGNSLIGSLNDTLFGMCNYFNGLILNLSNNLISGGVPADITLMCRSLVLLNVAGNRISGMIPQSIGSLTSLLGLDLSMNGLQGQIPAGFGELKGLNYLSLAGNNINGEIPSEVGFLTSLRSLDLSSNSLTGEIPGSLVTLKNLTVLLLNNNKLSGKIPSGFANMKSLSMFNVSYNNLSGPLPLIDSTVRCDSVLGNPLLQSCHVSSLNIPPSYVQGQTGDSQIYAGPPPETSFSNSSSSSGFSSIEIASVTSASAIVAVLLALVVLYIYTRKCTSGSSANSPGRREVSIFVDIGVPLTYESVVRATGSFNASNCIGSGGFGATYKAEISPGVIVAIKRLSVGRIQGVQQFHAEIKTLGRWRHPNLVTLIGYHIGEAEMFLIYNYLPGGNLERFIQERSKRAVNWRMLHKIAFDVARALAYLHDQCVPRILHRDVKPSNILLDNDFNAYLSDFGLARLLGNSETHATTGVAGTFGYVAPEYAMTCRVSDKADVYSYGVVLLELISNKKALDPSFSPYGNGFNIVAWACMLLGQGRAREFFADGLWNVAPHDDLVETLHLAVKCTVDSLTIRPTMSQVVKRLKELQPPSC